MIYTPKGWTFSVVLAKYRNQKYYLKKKKKNPQKLVTEIINLIYRSRLRFRQRNKYKPRDLSYLPFLLVPTKCLRIQCGSLDHSFLTL